jgi:hypothetical protein
MIAVATKHANVVIDTSAYTVKRFPPELVAYMRLEAELLHDTADGRDGCSPRTTSKKAYDPVPVDAR